MKREGYLRENFHYFHLKDTAGQERDFHYHEFDKIVILLSGKVVYAVENQTYTLQPWDVLLVKHHCIHKAIIDQSEYYQRIILYLDGKYFDRAMPGAGLMAGFDRADRHCSYRFAPVLREREELESILGQYEAAAADSRPGKDTLQELVIMALLVHINRMVARQGFPTDNGETGYDPKIQQILTFINENLSQPMDVEHLANQVYLSKYHFMRLFKTQTGSTVHAYIRQKRLLYSSRLIRAGVPVNRAAEEAGFTDYSVFHRAFRESFGIAPGQLSGKRSDRTP